MTTKRLSGLIDKKLRAGLLPALYAAQDEYGWLSPEAINQVSEKLNIDPGQVYSTASFYTMFRLKPQGRYRIQVCEGLSCYLVNGADSFLDYITQKLGITNGEITPDNRFSLEIVQCLAACDRAPFIVINDELYGDLTVDALDQLLNQLP